ncbi:kinase-like domain-containing protein [Mycena sp. CBHHK59/15]|nr:kinase-like domain-containing protein [Mycena sp. CBHHK59/15]
MTNSFRMWAKLLELALSSEMDAQNVDDDTSPSTLSIFSMLYAASENRKQILKSLNKITVIRRSHIQKALIEDNVKIAGMLRKLFESNSYKKDIPTLPQDHTLAVLNLTHYILDRGLPANDVIKDYKMFSRRAHRLLNLLATHLRLLPDELAVKGVSLLDDHPVKHGGFSNIYHGRYTNEDGEQVEVALKVLKIFEDQSDELRHILHDKFSKEALVWHYLKHRNIVPFLGVDSETFPSPARAMVSPWMSLGSVLKYMSENSPLSPYAIELLCGVMRGLNYLHSVNIAHGDLCGRNILMDKHAQPRLTDFGLAAFIESDTAMKTSTRSGSIRWMAPELLLPPQGVPFRRTPASDIWAFGCVCCEIWTEGIVPFSYIGEARIIIALSDSTDPAHQARPYQDKPSDKSGNPMPDRLWEIVQWCWRSEPSERPTGQVIADMLSEMRSHARSLDRLATEVVESPIAGGSGESGLRTKHMAVPSPSPVPSVEDFGDSFLEPSPVPSTSKGKQRVHFQDEYTTVRFGPLDLEGDPEEVFVTILEGLLEVVRRGCSSSLRWSRFIIQPILICDSVLQWKPTTLL